MSLETVDLEQQSGITAVVWSSRRLVIAAQDGNAVLGSNHGNGVFVNVYVRCSVLKVAFKRCIIWT